ncbi:gag-pol polyprotein [Cucumis melo var. makuwa]|uniref:Gag-pol polyprotein n=1 Tax=Cucumis melo var. makuwa TaxID=1194695 RepID=A0A5D3CAE4_CUCMM|nr:gag-pol polyprotein [Cucumis melo var. makuwa]TYK07296.1 gag-pol polyprotein [Cucumis melo var. makuwa]
MNGVSVLKPEVDWTDAKEQVSIGNTRALNAIFNGVDLNIFMLINSCSTAKEAWKTLEVAYEGTSKVKISRLQLITSKFEALRMIEDESVSDYNKRVLEIVNESLLLGEKIPYFKKARKVLRSLPKKFDMKVTAIEEAHDITMLKLVELFGSLLTFEMAIADRESKKGKGIAFKSTHVSEKAVECPTFLKRQKKAFQKNFRDTLSDEDTDDNEEDNGMNAFTIHITKTDSDDESESSEENYDNELTFEELKVLWKEDIEARAIQEERIQDLMEENERLVSIISSIKLKLIEVQKDYD